MGAGQYTTLFRSYYDPRKEVVAEDPSLVLNDLGPTLISCPCVAAVQLCKVTYAKDSVMGIQKR